MDLQPRRTQKNRTAAIVLSLVVLPGLGQCFQRRWLTGITIMTAFTASFVWAFIRVAITLWKYYDFALYAKQSRVPDIDSGQLCLPLIIVAIIYIVNMFDIIRKQTGGKARR